MYRGIGGERVKYMVHIQLRGHEPGLSRYPPICQSSRLKELFSALGAPRKVVDTVLESATHGGRYRPCAIFRIFQHRE